MILFNRPDREKKVADSLVSKVGTSKSTPRLPAKVKLNIYIQANLATSFSRLTFIILFAQAGRAMGCF